MTNPKYPEHEKLAAIQNDTQAQGELLEFLGGHHITLCEYRGRVYCCPKCRVIPKEQVQVRDLFEYYCTECDSEINFDIEGYYPINKSIEDVLAEMHDIDQKKIEKEKKRMLKAMRA